MTDASGSASTDDAGNPRCRRCGEPLLTGLLASTSRHCCLDATPIVGACPEHGPLGPHHVVDGDAGE